MRTFNPEKELNKIQKGNKNKIILGVISLLLIISIGSSYALYQIKYNKRIIYTTVDKFYSKDLQISVYVNGKEVEEFPDKSDNYSYSGYECENDSEVIFDYNDWTAQIKSTGPDKCKINFGPKNSFYDTLIASEDVVIDETNDANLRYIGANPANYIWFNCLKYDGLTKENAETDDYKCEKWRIIGIMNNMTTINENSGAETDNQGLVKIIRSSTIGYFSWDNKDESTGAENANGLNDWPRAELMYLLNPNNDTHTLNNITANNSLYWNSDKGQCSRGANNTLISCDFQKTGLKGKTTKEMIENVKWLLGAIKVTTNSTIKEVYLKERGNETCYTLGNCKSKRALYWDGKISLLYVSDYGYATSGNTMSRQNCLEESLLNWHLDEYFTSCPSNDWIQNLATGGYVYYLTPGSWDSGGVNRTNSLSKDNYVYYGAGATSSRGVAPTLYLKPTTNIVGGLGTEEEPYIVK